MPLNIPNKDESREAFVARCLADAEFTKAFDNAEESAGRLYDNKDDYERAAFSILTGEMPPSRLVQKFRANPDDAEMYSWEVEVFAVGTWNGYTFTKNDLDEIVRGFSTLHKEGALEAPLKFGHNDEQALTDGYPALGWIDELFVKDDEKGRSKLWARFVDVPKIVYEAAKKKLYRKVSIELEFDVEHKGRRFPYMLTGIALLGADLPAVNTIADLAAYMGRGSLTASRRASFSAVSGNINERKSNMAEIDDKELEALRAQAKKAADAEAEIANFRKQENDRKVKTARDTINGILDKAVTDLRATPAQRAAFAKILKVDDDEAVLSLSPEDVEALLPTKSDGDGGVFGRQKQEQSTDNEDTDELLHSEAKKIQAASGGKLSYARSLEQALRQNEDVAKKHLCLGEE